MGPVRHCATLQRLDGRRFCQDGADRSTVAGPDAKSPALGPLRRVDPLRSWTNDPCASVAAPDAGSDPRAAPSRRGGSGRRCGPKHAPFRSLCGDVPRDRGPCLSREARLLPTVAGPSRVEARRSRTGFLSDRGGPKYGFDGLLACRRSRSCRRRPSARPRHRDMTSALVARPRRSRDGSEDLVSSVWATPKRVSGSSRRSVARPFPASTLRDATASRQACHAHAAVPACDAGALAFRSGSRRIEVRIPTGLAIRRRAVHRGGGASTTWPRRRMHKVQGTPLVASSRGVDVVFVRTVRIEVRSNGRRGERHGRRASLLPSPRQQRLDAV